MAGERQASERQSVANLLDERARLSLGRRAVRDDAVRREDDGSLVVLDGDEVVLLQRRERLLQGVDVGLDAAPQFEHRHPLLAPVDERVQHRDLELVAVPELASGPHRLVGSAGTDLSVSPVPVGGGGGRTRSLLSGAPEVVGEMGLRCSLLGHRWDDPRVEQEREETDAEAVTTVREFRECTRCGAREVLSENVEVTAREPDGVVVEDAETGDRTVVDGDEGATEGARPDADDGEAGPDDGGTGPGDEEDGAVILDQPDDREYGEWPDDDDVGPPDGVERDPWPDPDDERPGDAPGEAVGEHPGEAVGERPGEAADDATGTDPSREAADDRTPGEGADDETHGEAEAGDASAGDPAPPDDAGGGAADPDAADGRERATDRAAPDDEGAVVDPEGGVADDGEPGAQEPVRGPADGEEEDVELLGGGGPDPDPGGGPADDGPSEPTPDRRADDGVTRRAERPGGPSTPQVEDGDVEVFCPNCGYVADEAETSLRGGDSCPSCRGSYLDERPSGR
jgi:hypothetical protein